MLIIAALYGYGNSLGANPVEAIQDSFGQWGLRFLLLTLAVTPARKITGYHWLSNLRRMIGLFAFFYAALHFLTWLILDRGLTLGLITADIVERPFITIGVIALIILVLLAITSPNLMRRKLKQNWNTLHRMVYIAAILSVWHYWWQVKLNANEPLIYAIILSLLLGYRLLSRKRTAQN